MFMVLPLDYVFSVSELSVALITCLLFFFFFFVFFFGIFIVRRPLNVCHVVCLYYDDNDLSSIHWRLFVSQVKAHNEMSNGLTRRLSFIRSFEHASVIKIYATTFSFNKRKFFGEKSCCRGKELHAENCQIVNS